MKAPDDSRKSQRKCYVAFGFQRPPAKVIEKTNIRIDLERKRGICILS